jgi:hypothetical protein
MDEFQLNPPLPLPAGQTEADITALFGSVELEGAPKQELENYWQQDWRSFVYTYRIVSGLSGTCLELGANPNSIADLTSSSCFRLTFTKTIRRRPSRLSKSQRSSTSARTISDNTFSRGVATSGLPGPSDRLGSIAATPPVN